MQNKVWSLVQQAVPFGILLEIQISLLIQNQKVGKKDGNHWAPERVCEFPHFTPSILGTKLPDHEQGSGLPATNCISLSGVP